MLSLPFLCLYFLPSHLFLPWCWISFAHPFFSLHWVKPLWRVGFWQWCVWCLRSDITHSHIWTHTWIRRPFIDVSLMESALTCAFGFMWCLSYLNYIAKLVFSVDNWWISNWLTGLLLAFRSLHVMMRPFCISKREMLLSYLKDFKNIITPICAREYGKYGKDREKVIRQVHCQMSDANPAQRNNTIKVLPSNASTAVSTHWENWKISVLLE